VFGEGVPGCPGSLSSNEDGWMKSKQRKVLEKLKRLQGRVG
jgi:hypothetical protein